MISVISSLVTNTDPVGTTVARVIDGQQTGMINERKIDSTGIRQERDARITDITKAMDIEIDVLMTMLTMRDITTIMEVMEMMRRGTETGTMSILRE